MKIIRCLTTDHRIVTATDFSGTTANLVVGNLENGFVVTDKTVSVEHLLPPVAPPAVYCIGLNYRRHAAEVGAQPPAQPVVFFKAPTSVIGPDDGIVIPHGALASEKTDYECELAVVIGRACKNAAVESALDFVAGYTCANDVSARDWQIERSGGQWCRGKTFDTFCPLGPALVTVDELRDPQKLAIATRVNGETVQQSHTSDMIFSVREIVAFLSADTTLLPGTVILTGTPEGVGMGRKPPRFLVPGDVVEIEIEQIGTLRNTVR
jgi:2-keto-4-pentenoate hydratase/2-oxohepta-3-ene-1,7-dioic acid hydratase in catechol pathway